MSHFRTLIALAAATLAGASANAQPSATVVTTLTDPVSGLPISQVAPGQTVRMRTTVSWLPQGTQMAGIKGDMLCAPAGPGGEGVISNRFSEYNTGGLVNLGAVVGDDVIGIDIAVTPAFFTGGLFVPPTWNYQGIDFTGYDWTAPAQGGVYDFRFDFDTLAPNFRVYPSVSSPAFAEVPTTVVGALLTVVPAPFTLGLLLVAPVLGAGRARRR